ncbi:MAG: hypothetical protein ACE5FT_01565 [Candidatus Nanoarchaeia archaeon]
MGVVRKVKCVVVEGENVALNYSKIRHEWDLPCIEIDPETEMLISEVNNLGKKMNCTFEDHEFMGMHEYDHEGDLHRTYLFKANVKDVEEKLDTVRLIPIENLDKPTLSADFAKSLPLLKKKLLFKS